MHSLIKILVVAAVLGFGGLDLVQAAKKSKQSQADDPMRCYQRGVNYLNGGRPDLAIPELEKVVTAQPENTVAIYALGLGYFGMRSVDPANLDRAKQVFEGLLERDPMLTDAHNALGLVYLELGDRVRGRQEFERVLADKRYQKPEVAQFNLGAVLLEDGLLEEAIAYLRAAATAKPEQVDWRYRYGLALEAAKRWEDARKEFDAAIQGKPTFVEALYHQGLASVQLKDPQSARHSFTRVRDLAPNTELAAKAVEHLAALGE